MNEADKWKCPWCGRVATIVRESICDSRLCECGAVAIGAAVGDWDEVTDEAIDFFDVTIRQESAGFESLLREDIRRAGVETRPGVIDRDMGRPRGRAYIYAWFRRRSKLDPPQLPAFRLN